MFLALILIGAFSNSAIQGTTQLEECRVLEFKPASCWNSEQLEKLGKWSCKVQGKELVGRSDCQ